MGAAAKSPLSTTFFNTFPEMNITIIGHGKMGHEVEQIALSRGHNIVAKSTKRVERPPQGYRRSDRVFYSKLLYNITQVIKQACQ